MTKSKLKTNKQHAIEETQMKRWTAEAKLITLHGVQVLGRSTRWLYKTLRSEGYCYEKKYRMWIK